MGLLNKQLPEGKSRASARKMVKQAFNAMLNADKYIGNAPNGVHPKEFDLTWAELSDAITEFHAPIAHHFYTGVGLRLQRIDSDIAELVMLHFANKGIPILPLHDSFLMHHGYETELAQQMDLAFQKVTGYKPKIDAKYFEAAADDTFTEDDKTHYYVCEPHISMSMAGAIIVGLGSEDDRIPEVIEDSGLPNISFIAGALVLVGAAGLRRRTH